MLVSAPGRRLLRVLPWRLISRWVDRIQHGGHSPVPHRQNGATAIRTEAVAQDQARYQADRTICGHAHEADTRVFSTPQRTGVLHCLPAWRDSGAYGVLTPAGFQLVDSD